MPIIHDSQDEINQNVYFYPLCIFPHSFVLCRAYVPEFGTYYFITFCHHQCIPTIHEKGHKKLLFLFMLLCEEYPSAQTLILKQQVMWVVSYHPLHALPQEMTSPCSGGTQLAASQCPQAHCCSFLHKRLEGSEKAASQAFALDHHDLLCVFFSIIRMTLELKGTFQERPLMLRNVSLMRGRNLSLPNWSLLCKLRLSSLGWYVLSLSHSPTDFHT